MRKILTKNILNTNNITPPTVLLENINHYENMIRNKILKFENYKIKHFPRVEFTIKSEIMKLRKLSVLTIYSLICKYENKFNKYLSTTEIGIFLISLCKRIFRK